MTSNAKGVYKYSYIMRPFYLKVRTNLLIQILNPVSSVIAFIIALLTGMTFVESLLAGFFTGAGTMLTWMLAREIDPDNDWSAFVGVVLVWIAMFVYRAPPIGLISLGALVAFFRMVNRVVGPPILMSDSAVLLLGIIIVSFTGNWIVAIIGVMAFLLDAILVNPLRRNFAFALVGLVMFGLRPVITGIPDTYGLTGLNIIGMIVVGVAFFLTMVATHEVKSRTDIRGYTLDVRRIRATMMLALSAGLVSALWNGDSGIHWMLPLWSAMLGVALFRIPTTFPAWRKFQQERSKSS